MRNPPHYLRFARSLALVGALGFASCGDDDKQTGDTADTADTTQADITPDTVEDVADTAEDTAEDTVADTSPDTVEDTVEDTVADTEDTTEDVAEDTVADTEVTDVDCDECADCGSVDITEECIQACCIAVGPLYPPDLPA